MDKQQQQHQQQQGIHCKVTYNDQFRRFLFVGNAYADLKDQIRNVLQLDLQLEFILKYKDNEGDLITISSDEELKCGISFCSDVLRLSVVIPYPLAAPSVDSTTLPWRHSHSYRGRGRGCSRGRGGRGTHFPDNDLMDTEDYPSHPYHIHPYHGPPYRGRGGRGWSEASHEAMKARLTYKRDRLKADIEQLTPSDSAPFKANLQMKLDRIESRLDKMSSSSLPSDTSKLEEEKYYKKLHKKEKKMVKKHTYNKRGVVEGVVTGDALRTRGAAGVDIEFEYDCYYDEHRQPLSEETLAQIASLKLTLVPFKLTLKTTKNELKLRKHMLIEAGKKQMGKNDSETLVKEIENLKNLKKETRAKIHPIKQQIRQLKFGGQTATTNQL